MVQRWLMELGAVNFKPIHRDRSKHMNADGLSKKTEHYTEGYGVDRGPLEEVPFMPPGVWRDFQVFTEAEKASPDCRKNPERAPRVKKADAATQATECDPEVWRDPDMGGMTPAEIAQKYPELLADDGWGPCPVDTGQGLAAFDPEEGWVPWRCMELEAEPKLVKLETARPSAQFLWDTPFPPKEPEFATVEHIDGVMRGYQLDLDNRELNYPHPPLEMPVRREDIEEVKLLVAEPRYLTDDLVAAQNDDPCMKIYRRIIEDEKSRGKKLSERELRARFRDMPVHYKTYFTQHRRELGFSSGVLVKFREGDRPALLVPPVYRYQVCAR